MDLWSHDSQPKWSTITQPATVRCLSQKPGMKCSNRRRLREVFYLQVGCLCSKKPLQGKENLAEAYCDGLSVIWSTASAASSTFIHTFYYDLMHSPIPSTSVASSEENLLFMTLLLSVQFLLSHFAVWHFMFYFLKRINEFCFRKLKWQNVWKWTADAMAWLSSPKTCRWAFCLY